MNVSQVISLEQTEILHFQQCSAVFRCRCVSGGTSFFLLKTLLSPGFRSGHIPLSKCMPYFGFLDDKGMFLSIEQLKQYFEKSEVDLKKPLCGTCGSGVTACHMVLAAHLCGAPGVPVFDGSWYEWITKAPPEHVVSQV